MVDGMVDEVVVLVDILLVGVVMGQDEDYSGVAQGYCSKRYCECSMLDMLLGLAKALWHSAEHW